MTSSRAFSSPNRYSSGPPTTRMGTSPAMPCGLHLLDGPAQRVHLALEAGLDADERLPGAEGEGGDGHALHDLVRVGPHDGPVLERGRLALGPVGHDVAVASRAGRAPRPTCARSGTRRRPGPAGRTGSTRRSSVRDRGSGPPPGPCPRRGAASPRARSRARPGGGSPPSAARYLPTAHSPRTSPTRLWPGRRPTVYRRRPVYPSLHAVCRGRKHAYAVHGPHRRRAGDRPRRCRPHPDALPRRRCRRPDCRAPARLPAVGRRCGPPSFPASPPTTG